MRELAGTPPLQFVFTCKSIWDDYQTHKDIFCLLRIRISDEYADGEKENTNLIDFLRIEGV